MPIQLKTVRYSKFWSPFSLKVLFICIFACGTLVASQLDDNSRVTNIGATVDENLRIGREEKTAMEIAVQDFNSINNNRQLALHVRNPGADPLEAASAVKELIEEKKVKAIIGMHAWSQAAAVSGAGSQAQVPILSLAAPAITPPSASGRWPFLIQMAKNGSEVIRCVAAMVESYKWKKVIAVHEDDAYDNESGMLTLLSEALQEVGTKVEHRVSLPPLSSTVDSKEVLRRELQKVLRKQSRVFIVLHTSLPTVTRLFREAKQMGLVGRDSAWIITDSIANFLDTFNASVISTMEGALGIKTYYSENTKAYRDFYGRFKRVFRSNFPEEDNNEPGIYALLAYDSIRAIIQALEREINITRSPKELLNDILSSNFNGLSGRISFEAGSRYETPLFRIVNVVGKSYKELAYWIPRDGFSKDPKMILAERKMNTMNDLVGPVNWPGDLMERIPKGWVMPSDAKPMLIGVPGRTSFEKFVKVGSSEDLDGFCIDIFREVEQHLGYALPHNIVAINGTYDDLVNCVANKTYDAIIGDITILAERMKNVEFTQPYAESGLSLIVPLKAKESAWMIMKPFSWEMWMATSAMLIYTMFIVWFLEHQSNPEFAGPWKKQLGTAIWFTFCSLFFAHREKISSNLTRVVLAVWLFGVFILTSSYTASLSSMLTVRQLDKNVMDIGWLRRTNQKVGCDGDSFVRKYLEEVLEFNPDNIVNVSSEYDYNGKLQSGNIAAAFLEVPYARVFLNKYCKEYTSPTPTYRFGGLGFIFQKGSPIAADFSEAILELSENGKLNRLEEKWFAPSPECSSNVNENQMERLGLESFWGLYVISGATSTICFILFIIRLVKEYKHHQEANEGNATPPPDESVWKRTIELAKYFYHGDVNHQGRSPSSDQGPEVDDWSSSAWENASTQETAQHDHQPSPLNESENL